jgi:hypothetical protein
MPKDGLRRLPDHVVAPLLRALMTIPRRPASRLLLQRRTPGRPPGWDREPDYDVMFRGRAIGRIWRFDYARSCGGEMAQHLWHWQWRDVPERADMTGNAPTLEAAMAGFRQAWDRGTPTAATAT